jgi:hypothetical protein
LNSECERAESVAGWVSEFTRRRYHLKCRVNPPGAGCAVAQPFEQVRRGSASFSNDPLDDETENGCALRPLSRSGVLISSSPQLPDFHR